MRNALVLPIRHAPAAALAAALSFVLAACGGGGGGGDSPPSGPPTPPPVETLFVAGNAWPGGAPREAQTVTPEEFRRRQTAGELQLIAPDAEPSQRAARRTHLAAQRSFLQAQSDLSPEASALLAQAGAAAEIDAEPVATLPDGQTVTLLGLGTRIEEAANSHRQARDPASALASYALSYDLLTEAQRAQLPSPDSLRQGPMESIRQAAQQMSALLAAQVNLDNTRLDPDAPVVPAGPSAAGRARALSPGNGVDNTGACAPTGYVRRYWFPLRGFVSPVKQQGTRGTCWAFAAIGAVESRERVQYNNPANLSEQFFINKYKLEWYPAEFFDGGLAAEALNSAVDRNQILLPEAGWTYNPAPGRPANRDAAG
ncbi:MAG TPA: C1 family peptidase, partial [Rhizobacter sp.]|nr:C1 family peptidase [Rhizobacter sp.]